MTDYRAFLEAKMRLAPSYGFAVDPAEVNPALKDFVRQAIVPWAAAGGRRAIFSSFGLHKTSTQIELARLALRKRQAVPLITVPLGVRHEFFDEAEQRFTGEHAVKLHFIRRTDDADPEAINLTNYESVRDGKVDPRRFGFASLDEAAVLRGFGGTKTFREFMRLFDGVPLRYVATATPDPNEFIELLAYSAFLGVMDVGEAKTRFFKRDSEKADRLVIHPHKQKEFWLWVASWALFIRRPSDLCRSICLNGSNCSVCASAGSSSSDGSRALNGTVPGAACATAASSSSPHQITSSKASSSVADVSGPSTAARAHGSTGSGAASSTDAPDQNTRTGPTMAAEESPSATAGENSTISDPTWASRHPAEQSSASTTTATMSRGIADGPREPNRPATADRANSESSACPLDDGYILPPLDVRWHELPSDHSGAGADRDGQGRMFRDAAIGVVDAAAEKRSSLDARVAKLVEIVKQMPPDDQLVIWCDLNDEQRSIERALGEIGVSVSSLYGNQDIDYREELLRAWKARSTVAFLSKPTMYGAGINMQQSHTMIFAGIGHKFHDFVQSLHRCHRFGQKHQVTVHLIYSDAEREIRRSLEAKWARHEQQAEVMSRILSEYGLTSAAMAQALQRSIGCERNEASGERWRLVNNDCVDEARRMDDGSVDLIVTSIPFATQYEYTPSYNDFGHTDDNAHFWQQMDYLSPELLRVLEPGRVMAVHVKDRIVPGGLTGLGFQTLAPFHAEAIFHYQRHGFAFLGMKTVVTDVVRENNQTYRLGWTEQCKDGSRMGCGVPEYVLLFRKPPTDRSNGYADVPVVKEKPLCDDHGEPAPFDQRRNWKKPVPGTGYSRARWQMDAHGFARSSGDRLLSSAELLNMPHDQIYKLWRARSLDAPYDFKAHVAVAEELDRMERLPSTFMLLPPHSWHPDVWSDVARMRTLNGLQAAAGREMHLCPLQFDIVDRLIVQFSMPGETVFDPFAGIGTVPYCAVKLGRRGLGVELSAQYFRDAVHYCEAAEREATTPTLFDLMTTDEAAE